MTQKLLKRLLVEIFLESYYKAPRQILLDLDVTNDLVHDNQEQAFFNTYYGGYCYAPLYIFCGKHLLAAKLRPSYEYLPEECEQIRLVLDSLRQHRRNAPSSFDIWADASILHLFTKISY